jgi:hypothetical protein
MNLVPMLMPRPVTVTPRRIERIVYDDEPFTYDVCAVCGCGWPDLDPNHKDPCEDK